MMIRNAGKKLRERGGYTLVEMLAAILVLALMCAGIGTGLSVVSKVYQKMMFQSDSLVLEDTIDTEFSYVLRYADQVIEKEGPDGKSHLYFRTSRNLGLSGEGGGYVDTAQKDSDSVSTVLFTVPDDQTADRDYLVNPGAYLNMSVRDFSMVFDPENQLFTGSYTIVSSNGLLEKHCEFSCASLVQ